MARRALIEILGDASGFKRSTKESVAAANQLSHGLKKLSVDAKASANAQVAASVKKTNRMRHEVTAYRELASSAKKGSREQVAAANLASSAEKKLARSLGVTAHEQRELALSAKRSEHMIGRGARGALAGSGAFRSMGRSIAFASGAFIGVAGVSSFLHSSIEAAVEASATQKQLAAQFKASGMNLKTYQGQIDETTARLSSLSGFTRDDLVKTFTTAFRGTKNVSTALKLESVAADAARGSHKELSTVSLALTKGVLGSSGALRRLGIIVPKTAHGMQVLNFVQRKFAGQARAGTTAQQRFAAELHNSQVIIGSALLPVITRLLAHGARWLSQMNRTGRLQRGVNSAVRTGTQVVHGLLAVVRPLARALIGVSHALGGAKNTAKVFAGVFIGMKILKWVGEFKALAASLRGVAAAEAMAGGAGGLKGLPALSGGIGALAVGGAAGAALAFGQRGETSSAVPGSKALGAQVLGDTIGYKDPVTGKHVLFNKKHGQDADAAIKQDVLKRHPELGKHPVSGDDVRLRGAGALGTGVAATPGKTEPARSGRLGLKGRFDKLELALAQADLTSGSGDDKRILQQQAANIRGQIGRLPRDHKHLQERTQLYQQLGQIQSSIQSIDQEAASKQKDAQDKQLARKKKEREREKKHNDKLDAEEKKKRNAEKEREAKHREALKKAQEAVKERMAQAVEGARSLIGDLFSGPVLNPSEADRKRQLGVKGPDAHRLVADVVAQTRAFRGTTRDLGVLRRAGASKQLIGELEGTDPDQLHALATASPKVRKQFLQAFAQRQKAIQSRARFDIHSPHVTVAAKRIDIGGEITVVIDHKTVLDGKTVERNVTKHQRRAAQRNAAQRGGRHAGTNAHP